MTWQRAVTALARHWAAWGTTSLDTGHCCGCPECQALAHDCARSLSPFPTLIAHHTHTHTSRGAHFPPHSSRGGILSVHGRERIPGVPVTPQEEALSTGKARETPGSCQHSQSPPDVSFHSRETCFPCTASTFKPRIDSHHGGTWDSLVGKPGGKASRESHRFLDTREGKRDTAATAREEIARACPTRDED